MAYAAVVTVDNGGEDPDEGRRGLGVVVVQTRQQAEVVVSVGG